MLRTVGKPCALSLAAVFAFIVACFRVQTPECAVECSSEDNRCPKDLVCQAATSLCVSADRAAGDLCGPIQDIPDGGAESGTVQIACGVWSSCAANGDSGTVHCWGSNSEGELGQGHDSPSAVHGQIETVQGLPAEFRPTLLDVHTGTGCAASPSELYCWGSNIRGQLGPDLPASGHYTATAIPGVTSIGDLDVGKRAVCSVGLNGELTCWGEGECGANGDPDYVSQPVPQVRSSNAAAVSMGDEHTCITEAGTGRVSCFGGSRGGRIRISDPSCPFPFDSCDYTDPGAGIACRDAAIGKGVPTIDATELTGASDLDAGPYHSCAVVAGAIWCWGWNGSNQLGADAAADGSSAALQVTSGLEDCESVEVAAGARHTCARCADGTVRCWGSNSSGQLGHGTISSSNLPVQVAGLTDAVGICAGWHHSCAVTSDERIFCWGSNERGQVGVPADHPACTQMVDRECYAPVEVQLP